MSLNQSSVSLRPAECWIIALAGVFTLALICWLPYHVPVVPTFSDSYLFGYSNRTALALAASFAVFAAVVAAKSGLLQEAAPTDQSMPSSILRRALWIAGSLALPLHVIVRHTGGYVESPYFLDRIKLVLDGKVPYRDFEYVYGASFLYLPASLARALHLQVADAYGLVWLAVNLLGIWMLFHTVQSVQAPALAKRGIFYFLFAMSVLGILCTGVNYSTFRFVLPLFLALRLYRRLHAANDATAQASSILLVVPCFLVLLLVSPEMALSFAAGMTVYLAIFVNLRLRANLAAFAAMLLLLGMVARAASAYGVFLTLNAFRNGGFNFPVVPADTTLVLLAALALTAVYAGIAIRARQGSPTLILIAVSALTLASALGRCDAGHILLSPLGLWIAALSLAAARPLAGRLALWTCVLVFFLIPLAGGWRGVLATPARAAMLTVFAAEGTHPHPDLDRLLIGTATRLYGPQKASLKIEEARRFAQIHDGLDLAALYGYPPGTIFKAPFQFSPEQFGPIHTPQVDTGYFYSIVNLVTVPEVQRKVAELAAHPERPVLLTEGAENSCDLSPEAERATIRKIFLYPYKAPAQNPDSILKPICTFIRDHYVLAQAATPDRLGYAVWNSRQANLPHGMLRNP